MNTYTIVRSNAECTRHWDECRRTLRPFVVVETRRGCARATVDVGSAGRTFTDFERAKLKNIFGSACRRGYWSNLERIHCRLGPRRARELIAQAAAIVDFGVDR